jgi:hypothetical protein
MHANTTETRNHLNQGAATMYQLTYRQNVRNVTSRHETRVTGLPLVAVWIVALGTSLALWALFFHLITR